MDLKKLRKAPLLDKALELQARVAELEAEVVSLAAKASALETQLDETEDLAASLALELGELKKPKPPEAAVRFACAVDDIGEGFVILDPPAGLLYRTIGCWEWLPIVGADGSAVRYSRAHRIGAQGLVAAE